MIQNAVANMNVETGKLPVMIVNNTNKHYKIKRGCTLGSTSPVEEVDVVDLKEHLSAQEGEWDDDMGKIDVPTEHRRRIERLVRDNRDRFAKSDLDLGRTDTVTMKIETTTDEPIRLRPYRTPLNKRAVVDKAIDEMLEAGVIRPSRSPYSFPIVVVGKKDGSKRFCVDYRKLNEITKKIAWPLAHIDDLLATLGKAKYFTTLDLKSGYWQVKMAEEDIEKTAFTCHRGLFEFNLMSFGLCNAPSIFTELMSIVLQNLGHFAVAYLDDILVYSEDLESHLQHLQIVLDRLREHNLKLKLSKCSFLKERSDYLGFVISKDGILPDPKKVECIKDMKEPTNVREVRGFLGCCSYYRRFVNQFSHIAKPIIALTKKYVPFQWTEECQEAFDLLKRSLMEAPVLAYPNPQKPYILYTDASDDSIGAVLCQENDDKEGLGPKEKNENPIHYLSHKLSDTQKRWPIIEKEAFSIYYALQHLDHYLHGAEFVIRTDHKPLKYLLTSPMQNRKIQMWALSIAGYNCRIEYIQGKRNCCADFLSRLPGHDLPTPEDDKESVELDEPDIAENTLEVARDLEVNVINTNRLNPREYTDCRAILQKRNQRLVADEECQERIDLTNHLDMKEEQEKDAAIRKLKRQLTKGTASRAVQDHHVQLEGVMYYVSDPESEPVLRLMVPEGLRQDVLHQFHERLGHMGIDKVFYSIRRQYYWKGLYTDVLRHVTKCTTCKERNLTGVKPPLQEMDLPPFPWAKCGVDTCGPFPKTLSGNVYIVTFVDWYSGWPEAFCVPDKSAETMAQLLLEEVFPRTGSFLCLVSDNGKEFTAEAFESVLKELNIVHIRTTVANPAGNGVTERTHRVINDIVSKLVQGDTQTWDLHLNQALAAIRFSPSETTKFSPFFLQNFRDVLLPLDNLLRPRRRYMGDEFHKVALNNNTGCSGW